MLHFQRRGSQLLDSSTKTCERNERKKKQLTSTKNRTKTVPKPYQNRTKTVPKPYQKPYQNRLKRKNRENTGKLQSLPRPETKCFFLFAFYEFFLLWFLSIIDTLLPRARSLSFFKLLDRHKLRHYARIFRKILPKWHDSILSSG